MTKLTPEVQALVASAGDKWKVYVAEREGLEKRVRARVLAEAEIELRELREAVAHACRIALEAGSTKTALKKVTTSDYFDFEDMLSSIVPKVEAAATEPAATVGLRIERIDADQLTITLDPATVPGLDGSIDPSDTRLWSGTFELFTRSDGKVLVDPTDSVPLIHGVTQWLQADRANEELVLAWAASNP